MEYIKASFRMGKDSIIEGREDTIPFVLSIKGVYSAHPPIAFLIVIDTSYSMDGEKIFRAKQAALGLLDILRDKDYVGVYGFAGKFYKVLEPVPATKRGEVERAIISLKLGSGTNIYDTLKKLVEETKKVLQNGALSLVRIIFITDGEPTVGKKNPKKILEMAKKLREAGASALIIGVGTEYNEKLLSRMAMALNGEFEHISDPASLEKLISEYAKSTQEVSAKNVAVLLRLSPGFRVDIYNSLYNNVPEGVEVEIGDIHYRETIDIVGDITTPPLLIGEAHIGDIHISYVNPETEEREFATPIPMKIKVKPPEEASTVKIDEKVLAEARMMRTATKIQETLGKRKAKDLEKELEELIETTMRVGSESLTAKTLNIKERIEKEGLTPETSKEMASVISRIISGRLKEEKKEEGEKNE
ncbi:vWA domain-containing protein [Staphylothermus hellenicus]|uniref:von Willebrand factor type A n=1 Tax=Staphylothermus hellenicus (strain DSM 12710 / JCM 10830 / BK20S6-10-b1 / P8) TaxID=591019 RepID=D7DB41_STAHD|nr:VWA domain-containing protein [Staphylothermus hellenicus]ADI31388.1 von Willebrand factor type A [Staphylothermus hellenicus DSM 12710]